ncbi:hypothetical protein K461DRAFT_324496 [Myriangium duriaei CBS 260.36]|uniref:Uncharacterized protein n=1 Tax=Myriangium duriaei CBS 260.36 TaxID=1168546 RepID=A0A9P4MDD3_9PEZI|nr:hypothetical protein K461DRAFT_324496 [Myriangium duriaei CBS 260.36]
MATSHTVMVQQRPQDIQRLAAYSWLQVAKSVRGTDGLPSFTTVFRSEQLGPQMMVAWPDQYGINWTKDHPSPGDQVTFSGTWQSCDLGQSYNLNSIGDWEVNNNNPNANPGAVNIGINNYISPVHIIVGIQDPLTKGWVPIWVAPGPLSQQDHAEYEPLQIVQIWYQNKDRTGTMISPPSTAAMTYDMTNSPIEFFMYHTDTSTWSHQPSPYPGVR